MLGFGYVQHLGYVFPKLFRGVRVLMPFKSEYALIAVGIGVRPLVDYGVALIKMGMHAELAGGRQQFAHKLRLDLVDVENAARDCIRYKRAAVIDDAALNAKLVDDTL